MVVDAVRWAARGKLAADEKIDFPSELEGELGPC